MPETEFELYLSLLSRFLRLKPAQHGEIADELRDHLEARLEELTSQGLSRDAAIRQALDEFGDAAELANHFTHLAHVRNRRLIMRFTFGTITALAASLLIATAFWPETPQAPVPQRAIAQFGGGGGGGAPVSVPTSLAAEGDDNQAIEAKLNKKIGTFEYVEVTIVDVCTSISEQIEADLIFDRAAVSASGISEDSPVTLKINHTSLSARVVLDLVLEPLKLSYTIRDGLIVVTPAENANQILVYNVRDLVQSQAEHGGAAGGMAAGPQPMMPGGSAAGMPGMAAPNGRIAGQPRSGFMGPMGGAAAPQNEGGMGGAGGMGGGFGGGPAVIRETDSLADLIAMTIDPASWDSAGGNGSVVQYRELLVVKNSQTVHGKIKVLLDMLRTSSAGGAPAAGARRG
jgi:hypothetical protein